MGINPWVLSRDKSLYGEDAVKWRPERWFEYSSTQLRYLGVALPLFSPLKLEQPLMSPQKLTTCRLERVLDRALENVRNQLLLQSPSCT